MNVFEKFDSELIIGNFIIESYKEDMAVIKYSDLYEFSDLLSKSLDKDKYFIDIDYNDIENFIHNYSYLIDKVKDNTIVLKMKHEDYFDNFITKLECTFRYGCQKDLINKIKECFKQFLDTHKVYRRRTASTERDKLTFEYRNQFYIDCDNYDDRVYIGNADDFLDKLIKDGKLIKKSIVVYQFKEDNDKYINLGEKKKALEYLSSYHYGVLPF